MPLKPQKHVLTADQYLNSLKFDPLTQQMTLLVAPTGVGKTTYTMENLNTVSVGEITYSDESLSALFDIVVILVPSVFKVQELETEYGNPRKNAKRGVHTKYCFFYGDQSPKCESLRTFKGVIVSTYDKFTRIKDELPSDLSQTILVLDECHKLYSVGSFRDNALTPIIMALQQRTFPNVLALTATFTQERWNVLDITYDQKHIVTKSKTVNHKLTVINLSNGDQYSFLHKIIDRIKLLKFTKKTAKKIIVRINHREKCEISAKLLTEMYGLKCLVVHSKAKEEEDVKEIFDQQKIPTDVQVVFTTSILDEAVNINNPTDEIDSVFIIGKTAHPEEVIQFMGRLRYANVPYFMVLHTGISTDSIDVQEQHSKNEKRIEGYTDNISRLSDIMSKVVMDYSSFEIDSESNDTKPKTFREKVNELNTTMESLCGCKLFAIDEGEVVRNYASIAALNYRQDKSMCFENFNYLFYRLRDLKPELDIQYQLDDKTQTEDRIKDFFKQQQEISKKQALDSIDDAMHIFLHHYPKLKREYEYECCEGNEIHDFCSKLANHSNLKLMSTLYIYAMKKDENYSKDLVFKYPEVKHTNACVEVLGKIISLAGYIGNLADIKKILLNEDDTKVLQVAPQYENNLLVIYMLKRFYRYNAHNYLKDEAILDASKAQKICINGIESLKKTSSFPMKTIASKNLITGLTYDDKNNDYTIASGKAFNFISQYFDVDDINKNKPKKRYLKFKGIAIGGYQYQALDKIQSPYLEIDETIDIKGVTYKNKSGVRVIDETLVEGLDEDVFDETPDPAKKRKLMRPTIPTPTKKILRKPTQP